MSRIHFSRLLDIISGSAAVAANNKIQKSALYKDFDVAKLEGRKLRNLIDANLPTFYIVNMETIYKEVIKNLDVSQFVDNEDYVNSKVFANRDKVYSDIYKAIKSGINALDKKPFLPILENLNKLYNQVLNDLGNRKSYTGYRNIATTLGANIRRLLKGSGVFIALDAKSIVQLPKHSVLVIGPTFDYTKTKVNASINDSIRTMFTDKYEAELSKYNNKTATGFSVGNIVNAGHTAAYSTDKKFIGVNMPFAQEIQFLLSGTGKEHNVDDAIGDLYLESKYAIVFKQNFTQSARNLLGLQFSFTISMPSGFNSNELRVAEVRRLREYVGKTILPSVAEQALKKFKDGILTSAIPELSASPNLYEYITSSVKDTLLGNKPKSLVKSSKANIPGIKIKTPVIKNTSLVSKKTGKKTKTGNLNVAVPGIRTLTGQFSSLASLQALLDRHLQDVISANMGNGSDRRILNYRTGRLASSAKVERLSASREGMITAFYSYMRNPYGTFSDGGKQQYPKSRDPKLLIAGAIREIAATQVGNRMRAVLV